LKALGDENWRTDKKRALLKITPRDIKEQHINRRIQI